LRDRIVGTSHEPAQGTSWMASPSRAGTSTPPGSTLPDCCQQI